jgi:hypothetical protein
MTGVIADKQEATISRTSTDVQPGAFCGSILKCSDGLGTTGVGSQGGPSERQTMIRPMRKGGHDAQSREGSGCEAHSKWVMAGIFATSIQRTK